MAKKTYIANTPLILQNEAGEDFRVETGEAVQLSPEQYEQVAAHVTPAEISDEAPAESGDAPGGETPLDSAQPEAPSDAAQETETKPKRGRAAKAAE